MPVPHGHGEDYPSRTDDLKARDRSTATGAYGRVETDRNNLWQLAVLGYEVRSWQKCGDERLHDDLVLSLRLVGEVEGVNWRPQVARGSRGEG